MLLCTSPGDSLVEEEVEEAEKEEGDEGHHKKVGKEDIVPHIDGVFTQLRGAQVHITEHKRAHELLYRSEEGEVSE